MDHYLCQQQTQQGSSLLASHEPDWPAPLSMIISSQVKMFVIINWEKTREKGSVTAMVGCLHCLCELSGTICLLVICCFFYCFLMKFPVQFFSTSITETKYPFYYFTYQHFSNIAIKKWKEKRETGSKEKVGWSPFNLRYISSRSILTNLPNSGN